MAADTLSQNEIDALLSAISQEGGSLDALGGAPASPAPAATVAAAPVMDAMATEAPRPAAAPPPAKKKHQKIKLYDFRRPDKFAKEHLRTINRIHENFARSITTTLSTTLRAMVNVQVISVDQVTYEEFIRSVPNPTVISIFDVGGALKGNAIFEMNLNVAMAIIERLFGGGGTSSQAKSRALTTIEEAVVRRIMGRMLDNLAESWNHICDIDPHIDIMESNPQFTAIVPPTEMVLLITFEIKVIDAEGVINLCFPHMVLEPVLEKLSAQFYYTTMNKNRDGLNLERITKSLQATKIPVITELGRTQVTIRDFLNLQVNDVVMLDRKVDDLLDLQVGDVVKFRGHPGLIDNNMAVTIVQVCEEEAEEG